MDNSGFISFYCLKLPTLEYSLTAPIVLILSCDHHSRLRSETCPESGIWGSNENITTPLYIFTGEITLIVVATAGRCYSCSICESLAAKVCLSSAWFTARYLLFPLSRRTIWFHSGSQLYLKALCQHNEKRRYSSQPKHPKLCIVVKRRERKKW